MSVEIDCFSILNKCIRHTLFLVGDFYVYFFTVVFAFLLSGSFTFYSVCMIVYMSML